CGACVVICPTVALAIDPKTRMVDFHEGKCTACELCVLSCPPRAMEVHF
ncbi:MAG: 4Fe-4S binding protein, partial [Dehalococcoidia bacterium]|nr:4Fe-4S binding protein [Dehalococcoidia bacterium]